MCVTTTFFTAWLAFHDGLANFYFMGIKGGSCQDKVRRHPAHEQGMNMFQLHKVMKAGKGDGGDQTQVHT